MIRTGLALAMLAAARFCPFLSLLMALIGSFLTVNVSLIYPAVLHLKIHQVTCDARVTDSRTCLQLMTFL